MITTETMKISYLHSPCLGIVFGTVCIALVMCLVARSQYHYDEQYV